MFRRRGKVVVGRVVGGAGVAKINKRNAMAAVGTNEIQRKGMPVSYQGGNGTRRWLGSAWRALT